MRPDSWAGAPRIGILGGGQLGKMLTQAAMNFNLHLSILDASQDAPASDYCHNFVVGPPSDYQAVLEFGRGVDLVTIEIEEVNVKALEKLQAEGIAVHPSPEIISIIQDKGSQKDFLVRHSLPTSRHVSIGSKEELSRFNAFFPAFQKLRRTGYDGRGVMKLNSRDDLKGAFTEPSLIEEFVDIDKEVAVIVARNRSGLMKTYPPVEMVFHEANLIDYIVAPADITARQAAEAVELARTVVEKMEIVGVAAVEMFLDRKGRLLVNEIAPRPHNSGHHTIDANVTSQYEQHLRAIIDLPLGATDLLSPAVMVNLIGEPGHSGPARYEGLLETLGIEGANLHIYGKHTTKPYRKMGHVTILDTSRDGALAKARLVRSKLRVVA